MKVAITGGIGSGKSFVCTLLKERNIEVYDCDSAAKRIMRESAEVRNALTNLLGADTYMQEGGAIRLNKSVIAQFLLASEANAAKINGIVHPAVAQDFKSSGINFMECALLFQSGFNKLVDKTICVSAPVEVRVRRVMQRDSISEAKALEWIGCQMPQDDMERLSDFVILNDGKADLQEQISAILSTLGLEKKAKE